MFGRIGFRGYTKGDFVSKGEGAISLSPSNIVNNSMDYDKCSYITWQKYEESPEIMIYNGDILLVKTGSSYGKSAIVYDLPEKATINPQFVVLKNSRIITSYLCYFLQSSYCISMYEKFVGGTAIPTFSQANLKAMYVAIPPLKEQSRIVNAIKIAEEQIVLIDDNSNDLQTDTNLLKTKILDLAIRGKLVPQNPDDEPASVLLDRIRAEKEELIKQGKIKRDKKESVIFKGEDNSYYEKIDENVIDISDEIPFDIPKNWVWCRLNTLCIKEIKRGKAPKYTDKSGTLVFAQKCNTKKGDIDISLAQYLDESILKKYSPEYFMQYNDIVINSTGTGTMGRVGIFEKQDDLYSLPIVADTHITTIRVTQLVIAKYVYSLLKSKQSYLETSGEGSTNQKELRPEVLSNILVPLPPALEQEQIINFINHINKTLNNIEQVLK